MRARAEDKNWRFEDHILCARTTIWSAIFWHINDNYIAHILWTNEAYIPRGSNARDAESQCKTTFCSQKSIFCSKYQISAPTPPLPSGTPPRSTIWPKRNIFCMHFANQRTLFALQDHILSAKGSHFMQCSWKFLLYSYSCRNSSWDRRHILQQLNWSQYLSHHYQPIPPDRKCVYAAYQAIWRHFYCLVLTFLEAEILTPEAPRWAYTDFRWSSRYTKKSTDGHTVCPSVYRRAYRRAHCCPSPFITSKLQST